MAATRVDRPEPRARMRLLAVTREPATAACLRAGFTGAGFEVSGVADGPEALAEVETKRHDVVILDMGVPELDDIDVTRQLRARTDAAIILLVARASVEDRIASLEAGADDVLAKPFALGELVARVRAVLRRRGGSQERALAFEDMSLNLESRVAVRGERVVTLTPREFELLRLLLTHPRQVLTRDTIRTRIWGYDFDGDDNVIEVYVRHLRAKLGDVPPRLIRTVRGVGYVLRGGTRS